MLTFEGQEFLGTQAIMTKIAVRFFRGDGVIRRVSVLASPTTSRAWTFNPLATEAS